ncbi:MAG: hypothetical protein A3H69_03675 [Candidatus Sungbacteria bacterium RIFCSPLOWO2_02_FULL_47_9]|uniref:Uncharacterized protein n=1 Tax=Candidatus Sungbacteria bacterium RIFCSPHIGHO2_01_FULL_47_32 TaxID=1802264 RepID=A0A1G2K544_9BACT|nr:MAG: hypothetical protein UX72_C0001G0058 [Parcubacteria group bacterium GW2011_GWA2_47_10]OGZ94283.1 MAG: hypothetical protein A2633_05735 [Candidatus Sungbacteria bacterium RIFCSPHIGHO2_01_FULL_47_32]OGZ99752.1 MAG: hypothetical protein A3D57_02525 [Candidatus Sungbacteria bacterium RIFCSPHIGHO2_02_FULL_46_12]OHA11642.1 MAG: hypothetical protein A3H69_03675 [Candidatus Sungbacteria bacterium RIFCSPLOWO2_02_FULL_47_9]
MVPQDTDHLKNFCHKHFASYRFFTISRKVFGYPLGSLGRKEDTDIIVSYCPREDCTVYEMNPSAYNIWAGALGDTIQNQLLVDTMIRVRVLEWKMAERAQSKTPGLTE